MKTTANIEIDIDKKEVYRRLGYKACNPPVPISFRIDSQVERTSKLTKPTYGYILKSIDGTQGAKVKVEGPLVFISKTLSRVLTNCEKVVIFLVTIGKDLEEEISRLSKKGEVLTATILDAIGSEATEKTAGKLEEEVRELAESMGWQATLRYSPGYCDWALSQQKALFQAIDSTSLGITLNENLLMNPRKSLSGIIGMGKFKNPMTGLSPCLACPRRRNCPDRR